MGLATPVGLVDPAGRVTVVDPGDTNRVAAATVGTAAATAPADLASREVPVVRVGMTPVDPEVPVGMIPEAPVGMTLVDPVVPAGMILVDPEGRLRAPNPVVRLDPERLVVLNPVARAAPGNREATDLRMGRALLDRMPTRLHLTADRPVRMPTRLHLTAARRLPMPALLHLTPADRRTAVDPRWDPTTRAVAACPEAIRAAAIRRAEAIRRVRVTDSSRTARIRGAG